MFAADDGAGPSTSTNLQRYKMTKDEERQARRQLGKAYPSLTSTADRIELDATEHDSGALIVKPAGEPVVYNYAALVIPPEQR